MWKKKNRSRRFPWNVFQRIDEEQASSVERSAALEPAERITVVRGDIGIAAEAAYGNRQKLSSPAERSDLLRIPLMRPVTQRRRLQRR
jgi:hypothetical protein